MTACQVAYTLYNTPVRIARIRSSEYIDNAQLFEREHCPVDVLISPETLVTDYIARLIEYPGALQVLDFADGRAQLVATQAYAGGPLVGHRLQTLREHMPADADARVAAIYRQDKTIIPDGSTVIEENDTVFFLAAQKNIRMMMRELRPLDSPIRRVILAGGGHIGANLARYLERDHHVKIIERDAGRADEIAEGLERAIVLVGDCADEELLREEAVDTTDVYCVLTNDDEANILSSMLAKKWGPKRSLPSSTGRLTWTSSSPARSISRSRHSKSPSARCSPTSAAATWCASTRCAAGPPRPSRRSRSATSAVPAWSAAPSRTSTCRRARPYRRSCVARK